MDDVAHLLLAKAEAVALRPGDTLVLNFRDPLGLHEVEALRARSKEALPDNKVVIVQADAVRVELADYERPEHRACRRQS